MTTPRSGPRPSINQEILQCLICSQFSQFSKFQLRERPKAVNLLHAAEHLIDEACTYIAELITSEGIRAAEIQIHPVSFPEHMDKWKEAKQKQNSQSTDIRFLLCLIEIFSSGM